MNSVKVLLVDDHKLVRAGISSLLKEIPNIEVIAEADDGRQALNKVVSCHPDVVLMDIAMQELNGLDATSKIVSRFPDVKVIILSMYVNQEYVWHALRSGASGYLLKDATPVELELAINSVTRGTTYLSPAVSQHVVSDYVRRVNADPESSNRLTPRQREIWQLIAEGYTTKEIAGKLGISIKTVETHRSQLMERLDTHDVAGLVRLAVKTGLITPQN